MLNVKGLCPSTAEGPGLIPGRGTKTSQAIQLDKTKQDKYPLKILDRYT